MVSLLVLACAVQPVQPVRSPAVTPARPDVVRFAALGDAGRGDADQRRVARALGEVCSQRGCDLVLLLGDNVYPRGLQRVDDPRADTLLGIYERVGVPVYAVLGNHDWGRGHDHAAAAAQIGWAKGQPWFHLPAPDHVVRVGPAEFFALDTTRVFWDGAGRGGWLAPALDASDAPWRVVFGHHPWRSDGPHGNAGAYEGWRGVPWLSGRAVDDVLSGLCGRADLYLAGHDHSRQWMTHCGVELLVSGGGSAVTEVVDRGNDPRFARASPGLVWVELAEALTVAFYDVDGALELEEVAPRPPRAR